MSSSKSPPPRRAVPSQQKTAPQSGAPSSKSPTPVPAGKATKKAGAAVTSPIASQQLNRAPSKGSLAASPTKSSSPAKPLASPKSKAAAATVNAAGPDGATANVTHSTSPSKAKSAVTTPKLPPASVVRPEPSPSTLPVLPAAVAAVAALSATSRSIVEDELNQSLRQAAEEDQYDDEEDEMEDAIEEEVAVAAAVFSSSSSEDEPEAYQVPTSGPRRPHLDVHIWDTIVKYLKEGGNRVKEVKQLFLEKMKQEDSAVKEADYINRADVNGSTLLHHCTSPVLAEFICSYPGLNLTLTDQKGSTSLFHHLEQIQDRQQGAAHLQIAKVLIQHGADLFAKNFLKGCTALDLVESKDLQLSLRKLANASLNALADPLLQGASRAYYQMFFDAVDPEKKGYVTGEQMESLWFRRRNTQLFDQAMRDQEMERLTGVKPKQPEEKSPRRKKKQQTKDAKSPSKGSDNSSNNRSPSKGSKSKAAPSAPPFPTSEEDRLAFFLQHWDIDRDHRLSFADFTRLVLEHERTSTPERLFQVSMLATPRVYGPESRQPAPGVQEEYKEEAGARVGKRSRRPSLLGPARSRLGSTPTSRVTSRAVSPRATKPDGTDIFVMTATRELPPDLVVISSASQSGVPSRRESAQASVRQSLRPKATRSPKGIVAPPIEQPSPSSSSSSSAFPPRPTELHSSSDDSDADGFSSDELARRKKDKAQRAIEAKRKKAKAEKAEKEAMEEMMRNVEAAQAEILVEAEPAMKEPSPSSFSAHERKRSDDLALQGPARPKKVTPAGAIDFPSPKRGKDLRSPSSAAAGDEQRSLAPSKSLPSLLGRKGTERKSLGTSDVTSPTAASSAVGGVSLPQLSRSGSKASFSPSHASSTPAAAGPLSPAASAPEIKKRIRAAAPVLPMAV